MSAVGRYAEGVKIIWAAPENLAGLREGNGVTSGAVQKFGQMHSER